jgi:hypothetical protein
MPDLLFKICACDGENRFTEDIDITLGVDHNYLKQLYTSRPTAPRLDERRTLLRQFRIVLPIE